MNFFKNEKSDKPEAPPTGKYAPFLIAAAEAAGFSFWLYGMTHEMQRVLFRTGGHSVKPAAACMATKNGHMVLYAPFRKLNSEKALYVVLHECCHAKLHRSLFQPPFNTKGALINTRAEAEADRCAVGTLASRRMDSPVIYRQALSNLKNYEDLAKKENVTIDPLFYQVRDDLKQAATNRSR